jgi:hypothetical protein
MADIMLDDLTNVKSALSKIAAFRTWCGAVNEAAALAYIKLFSEEDATLPICVVAHGPGWKREMSTLAAWSTYPEVEIVFIEATSKSISDTSALATLLTAVSGIMVALNVSSVYEINSWGFADGGTPERARIQIADDYVAVKVIVYGCQY